MGNAETMDDCSSCECSFVILINNISFSLAQQERGDECTVSVSLSYLAHCQRRPGMSEVCVPESEGEGGRGAPSPPTTSISTVEEEKKNFVFAHLPVPPGEEERKVRDDVLNVTMNCCVYVFVREPGVR
jgi:hypothetical protein